MADSARRRVQKRLARRRGAGSVETAAGDPDAWNCLSFVDNGASNFAAKGKPAPREEQQAETP
jgi:hypothetical protein